MTLSKRNVDIFTKILNGDSYNSIAKKYTISRTRVRQIVWRIAHILYGKSIKPSIIRVRFYKNKYFKLLTMIDIRN